MALKEDIVESIGDDSDEKILISLADPESVSELVDVGLMLKSKKTIPIYALHVTDDEKQEASSKTAGKKIIDKALKHASATENVLIPVTRFDISISHGIIYTIKEHNISDILIGLHRNADENEFFGSTAEQLIKKVPETIYIYKPTQPFNTVKKMVVVVPPKAEFEPGFLHWFSKLTNIAKSAGMPLSSHASTETLDELKKAKNLAANSSLMLFNEFNNWEDFLIFTRELKSNDLFVMITSRTGHVSYNNYLEKLPYYLSNYFKSNSFMIIYPKQLEQSFIRQEITQSDSSLLDALSGKRVNKVVDRLKKILIR